MTVNVREEIEQLRKAWHTIMDITSEVSLEKARQDFKSEVESWEVFSARRRQKWNRNRVLLETRFINGFQEIVHELAKGSGKES